MNTFNSALVLRERAFWKKRRLRSSSLKLHPLWGENVLLQIRSGESEHQARAVSSSSLHPRGAWRRECRLDSDLPKVMGRVGNGTQTRLLQKSHIQGLFCPFGLEGTMLACGLRPDGSVQTVLSYTVNKSPEVTSLGCFPPENHCLALHPFTHSSVPLLIHSPNLHRLPVLFLGLELSAVATAE